MKISLRNKLLFLVLLPQLAIVGLAAEIVWEQVSIRNSLKALVPMTEIATTASQVIHELQKERGQTVGLITNDFAAENKSRLENQRGLSNGALETYDTVLAGIDLSDLPVRLSVRLEEVTGALQGIGSHRGRVDARDMTVGTNVAFYTGIIVDLIEVISLTAESSPSQEITALLLPYISLVEAKEHSGLERAIGAAVLNAVSQGKFDRKRYEAYLFRLSGEKISLAQFENFASDDQKALFEETVAGPAVEQVEGWRTVLAEIPDTLSNQGVTGAAWFATATERINLIKAVEDQVAGQIRQATDDRINAAMQSIMVTAGISAALVLVFGTIGVAGVLPVANRTGTFVESIRSLANGDMERPLVDDTRQDDIGDMNRALVQFRGNIRQAQQDQEAQARAELEAAEQKTGALKEMANSVEGELSTTVSSISDEGNAMASRATDLSSISAEVSTGAQAVAAAAEEATATASVVSELVNEVDAALNDVAGRVTLARSSAEEAQNAAEETNVVVSRLEGAAAEVGTVVGLISDIAEQTNLLALNATIEAARAGDAGKGFAVVANEVKSLATQTSKSAAEITTQVEQMQATTREAVLAMSKIGSAIAEISDASAQIDGAVQQQRNATAEIANNAEQASTGSREVSARIADVTTSVSRVDSVAQELATVSASLRKGIDGLQSSIRKIVRTSTPEVNQREGNRRNVTQPVSSERRTQAERRTG